MIKRITNKIILKTGLAAALALTAFICGCGKAAAQLSAGATSAEREIVTDIRESSVGSTSAGQENVSDARESSAGSTSASQENLSDARELSSGSALQGSKTSDVSHGSSAEAGEQDEPGGTEPAMYFEDVKGIIYSMHIDPSVRRHDYDWNCLTEENGRLFYEDENFTSETGFDVSYFQGDIDWEAAASDGIDFAYIRIGYRGYGSEGTLNIDSKAEENLKGAAAAGIKTGVYFFSQAVNEEEAVEEAKFVLELIREAGTELPVVYDPEEIKNDEARTDGLTGDQLSKNVSVFCRTIKDAGYEPMLYTNLKWEAFMYDPVILNDVDIWYADYKNVPQTPYHFEMWQYSEEGKVAGIDGAVDLDLRIVPK